MFAPPQLFFRPPLIIDVYEQSVPSGDAASIVQERFYTDVHPPVDAVEALQSMIKLQRLSKGPDAQPLAHHARLIVGVNEFQAVEPHHFLDFRTCVVEKTFIGVFLLTG